jgi:uncharacterized phage protein (TIGR01671 family)
MREILFRGKRDGKEWMFGNLRDRKVFGDALIGDLFSSVAWEVQKETVGQYTGLDDKNGVKIFEGDIVHFKGHDAFENKVDRKVHVNDIREVFSPYNVGNALDCDTIEVTVIGNIHDNPELLEERE